MLSQQLVSQIQTIVFGKEIRYTVNIGVSLYKDCEASILISGNRKIIKKLSSQLGIEINNRNSFYIDEPSEENNVDMVKLAHQIEEELKQYPYLEVSYKEHDYR